MKDRGRGNGYLGTGVRPRIQHDPALQLPVTTVRFIVDEIRQPRDLTLVYLPRDYAFSSEPRPADCAYAVGVNDLELMIDEEDLAVVFATGYCPHPGWQPAKLRPPRAIRAVLLAEADTALLPGRTVGLTARDQRWPVLVDVENGWVCLGPPDRAGRAIEFASGCVAVLEEGALVAVWLHPKDLPSGIKMPSSS